jgi:adenosine deaminase
MSGTSMSHEMDLLSQAFGWGLKDMEWLTVNAMKSAFLGFDERLEIINTQIKPGYAQIRAELSQRISNQSGKNREHSFGTRRTR